VAAKQESLSNGDSQNSQNPQTDRPPSGSDSETMKDGNSDEITVKVESSSSSDTERNVVQAPDTSAPQKKLSSVQSTVSNRSPARQQNFGISTARVERRVQKLSDVSQTLPGRLPSDLVAAARLISAAQSKVFVGRPLSSERSEGLTILTATASTEGDGADNLTPTNTMKNESKTLKSPSSPSAVERDAKGVSSSTSRPPSPSLDREEIEKSPAKSSGVSSASSFVASLSNSLDFRRGRTKREAKESSKKDAKVAEEVEVVVSDAGEGEISISSGSEAPAITGACTTSVELVGLKNLGNTCFMNSALQCLRHTPELESILLGTDMGGLGREVKLSKNFAEMLLAMSKMAPYSSFSPTSMAASICETAPFFSDDEQHDCQEFLRMFLDLLHDDLNRVQEKPTYCELEDKAGEPEADKQVRLWGEYLRSNDSSILDLFCGQLQSSVKCHQCSQVFTCYDPFWDLPVPIPKKQSGGTGSCFRGGSTSTDVQCTLEECLDSFTEEEELSGDEKYFCAHCKSHQAATKWLRIVRFPRMLVVHLKRFSWSGLYTRNKISTPVSFPQFHLALDKYKATSCNQPSRSYDLYGVANHMGGMGGGHYTATCLNPGDNQWYTYNDNNVTKSRSAPTNTPSAYILFYKMNETNGRV